MFFHFKHLRTLSLKTKFILLAFSLLILSISTLIFAYHTQNKQEISRENLANKERSLIAANTRINNLVKELQSVKGEDARKQLDIFNQTLDKYETVKDKTASYKTNGVDVLAIEGQLPTVVDYLFAKKYVEADTLLTKLDGDLENALKQKQTADAAKTSTKQTTSDTCTSVPESGYCTLSVKTSNGTFTTNVVTANLNKVQVVTDTANTSNCNDQCPTKNLLSYIKDNGGYAGINGTYFCPADYASCAGKVASFDFPVYNTNHKKWINDDKLHWNDRAMLAFTSSGAVFYPQANSFSGLSGIEAGLVNFPGLVNNGSSIVNNYPLTSAQLTKGYRGGVGVKGSTIYLVITRGATVVDLANVMVSLGVIHALNLDGGGSSALIYQSAYKIGPGRSLPNALIIK